jgi:Mg-chelatase subunit ChlD
MKKYTDITMLVDRSGSMQSIKEQMESAFRNFVKEHKKVPSTKLTLIQFDDENKQEVIYSAMPIKTIERLMLKPRGNTPLLDAFVTAIDTTGKRLAAMSDSERPDQVLMVVITDGQENASTEFNRKDVFDRVTHQRNNYNWQFVYMGANQDSFAEAQSFNIPRINTMNFSPQFVCEDSNYLTGSTVSYANRSVNMVKLDEDEQMKNRNTTKTVSTT